jgi:hypothetical protein
MNEWKHLDFCARLFPTCKLLLMRDILQERRIIIRSSPRSMQEYFTETSITDYLRSSKTNWKNAGSNGELSLTPIGMVNLCPSRGKIRGVCLRKKRRRGSMLREPRLLVAKLATSSPKPWIKKVKVMVPLEETTIQQRV